MGIYLNEVELKNFRLFDSKKIKFNSYINVIIGSNATGKTTILESVNVLGKCKSFRTNIDKEMLKKGKDFYFIKGNFKNEDKNIDVVVSFSEIGKKVSVNGDILKKQSDYIGRINVVSFSPNDINIVRGDSRIKRNFLNQNISMLNKNYLENIIMYNKILKERNELLKNPQFYANTKQLLNIYTDKLINVAKQIVEERKQFIESLSKKANINNIGITNNKERLLVKYIPSLDINELDKIRNSKKDEEAQSTLYGPHKDTFEVFVNENEVSKYTSQGQQKTAVISMKLAVTDILKEENKEVIVVLDDVFGELDVERQEHLMENLKKKGQIFISTTDIRVLSEKVIKDSKIIKMDEGD